MYLHVISVISILLGIACSLLTLADLVRHPQKMWIMDLVWPLTALYLGPFALWFYYTSGRNTRGRGQSHKPPRWKASMKGSMHCGAGCTVGDFLGEWTVFLLGLSLLGSELLAKYAAAFALAYVFGILFQYFTIAPMRHLRFKAGVVAALKADTLSLVAFEVGMFSWMAVVQEVLLPGLQPVSWEYWFMMQIAMVLGLATTYPVNWWLLHKGLKEAM